MLSKFKLFLLILVTVLCGAVDSSAQTTFIYGEDFRANQTLRFSFGALSASNNPTPFSFSALGISTNVPASANSFGGLGVSPTNPLADVTGTTSIEVVARVDAGNQSDLVITVRETGAAGVQGEFFSYIVPASSFPAGGGFATVSVNPATGFNGDVTDGVLNGRILDIGIQTPFNGSAAQNFTVQSVSFIGGFPPRPAGQFAGDGCLPPVAVHGALSVSGTNIVDENGDIVSLAGNSFFWTNNNFAGLEYYTPGVVSWLQEDWGSTIVRASMGVDELGGFLEFPEANRNRVETVVDAAIANDMYVIIDWHSHHAEDFEADAISFFREMAQTYGDNPHVIYEIYNEPITRDWSGTIKPYSEAVIEAIRAIDPDNLIIVGTGFFSQEVDVASQDPIVGFDNIAYTLHFYAATHGESLRERGRTAIANGLALVVTEWGTVSATADGPIDAASTELWLAFLDENDISHLNWSVNDSLESSSIVTPNASVNGGWSLAELTPSGQFVREIIGRRHTCVPAFLLGDCNQDGVVDFRDISSFINFLTSGDFLAEADCNQDGAVNFLDISPFIDILAGN